MSWPIWLREGEEELLGRVNQTILEAGVEVFSLAYYLPTYPFFSIYPSRWRCGLQLWRSLWLWPSWGRIQRQPARDSRMHCCYSNAGPLGCKKGQFSRVQGQFCKNLPVVWNPYVHRCVIPTNRRESPSRLRSVRPLLPGIQYGMIWFRNVHRLYLYPARTPAVIESCYQ